MRFIHLKHQVFETETIKVDQCLRAIGKAISGISRVWYWVDNAKKGLEEFEEHLRETFTEPPKSWKAEFKLRKDYHDVKSYLEYAKRDLHELSRAFEEIARECGYRSELLEEIVKNLEHKVQNFEKLIGVLDRTYELKLIAGVDEIKWTLEHDMPYLLRDTTSKLGVIVNTIASRIERGLSRAIATVFNVFKAKR